MASAHDPHAITPELAWFSGWHDWERHLSDATRHRLASTRAAFEPPDEIELPFERTLASPLDDDGVDPVTLAMNRLEAELKTYPASFRTPQGADDRLQANWSDF